MTGRLFSPLTRRILTVNVLPLAILVAGILYLDEYREGLIESELAALETQAEIFAGALGEGAIGTKPTGAQFILPGVARPMLRRLTAPTRTRARVLDAGGEEIADSRFLAGQGGAVQVEALPPPDTGNIPTSVLNRLYDLFVALLPQGDRPALFPESVPLQAIGLAAAALDANIRTARWSLPDGGLLLGAAAPVQRFKQVLGAVMLTTGADDIDAAVRAVRFDIL